MSEQTNLLRDTLADLMHWVGAERLEARVIGEVAAGLHGEPRLTEDVDAVVLDCSAESLLDSGPRYGFSPRTEDALEFSRRTRVLLLRHRSGVAVDISLGYLSSRASPSLGA